MQGNEDRALEMLLNMLEKLQSMHEECNEEEDKAERKSLMHQINAQYARYLGACAAFDLAFDLEPGTMDSCAKAVYEHRNLY